MSLTVTNTGGTCDVYWNLTRVGSKDLLDRAVAALGTPGAGGLTLTVHPGGDRHRIETRFVPRQTAAALPAQRLHLRRGSEGLNPLW